MVSIASMFVVSYAFLVYMATEHEFGEPTAIIQNNDVQDHTFFQPLAIADVFDESSDNEVVLSSLEKYSVMAVKKSYRQRSVSFPNVEEIEKFLRNKLKKMQGTIFVSKDKKPPPRRLSVRRIVSLFDVLPLFDMGLVGRSTCITIR